MMFVTFNSKHNGYHVEQELLSFPEHLSSLPIFNGFHVAFDH
jgi:hypothetical protein